MTGEKRGYIDVDGLQREFVADGDVVERVAAFYHRSLPELHRTQDETRLACHFACGREGMTSDRALSVKTQADGAVFRCFQYGCTVRGNLLTLMYWMKHDRTPTGDRLKGPEFREIAEDLQALVRGESRPDNSTNPRTVAAPDANTAAEPPVNLPLKDSDNERARELVTLDDKFVTDVAQMNPKAAAYVRKRPFMTPEMMRKFRCGYLPNDAGSLLRGHFVYGWADANGDILTWFGRNLNYEDQHEKWRRSGDSKDEPSKFRFVKGFHRGLELFGEDIFRREAGELTKEIGVILVEGPNDVINLNLLGVTAVAVCSNTITDAQTNKLGALAREFGDDTVSVMFDLDREGEIGAKQAVLELVKLCCVRLAWTSGLAGGTFIRRQPESLTVTEWKTTLHPSLVGSLSIAGRTISRRVGS